MLKKIHLRRVSDGEPTSEWVCEVDALGRYLRIEPTVGDHVMSEQIVRAADFTEANVDEEAAARMATLIQQGYHKVSVSEDHYAPPAPPGTYSREVLTSAWQAKPDDSGCSEPVEWFF